MGKRVMVAVIFIPLLLVLFYGVSPAYPWALCLLIAALSMIAVHEVLWSTGFLKHARISGYSIILAGLIPFWIYYDASALAALCGMFVYVLLLFAEAIASHKRITLEKMGGAFFLTLVIPFFLSTFLRIRQMEVWEPVIVLPLVVAFISDAFALFAGMAFGRHKLAPELSPKKTVEGAVGGLVGAVVCTVLYGVLLQFVFHFEVQYFYLGIYGALGSLVSQLGDLSFSYIKREYGLKDFGNIFPGHGGVLDRFDSVIFCAPLIELLLHFLPAVGVS
ncbi:phosphatidate cytidylyltransferase [Flavonifractor hominis]|uniref:Phosphatidate cytidylyltransferase n=1 Tax=Flavonifractor hominis TaxID=3133178 RepID=A0ABV1EK94_9FIRM